MIVFFAILTSVVLAFICYAASSAYRRIPDFLPTQTEDQDGESELISSGASMSNGALSRLSPPLSRVSVVPGVVDIATWQHLERAKRLSARLDAIIEQQRDRRPPLSVLKPVPVRFVPRVEPVQRQNLLRGMWLLTMFTVIVGSLLPSDTEPIRVLNALGINDKIMHFLAYATIAFLPAIGESLVFSLWAGVGAVALGAGLEYGQLYSPGRAYEIGDMAANTVGVGFGLLVGMPLKAWFADIRSKPEWERLFQHRPGFTRQEIQPCQMR